MQGFDPKFCDFPDYIIGITKEIWEDRGIATQHRYYAPYIVVRSPAAVVFNNDRVNGAIMATLTEFPDASFWAKMSSGPVRPKPPCCHRTACFLQTRVWATGPMARHRGAS